MGVCDVIWICAGMTVVCRGTVCSGTEIEFCDRADCTTGRWTTGSLETSVVSRGQERMTEEAGILTGTWISETVCRVVADEATAGIRETEAGTAASDV